MALQPYLVFNRDFKTKNIKDTYLNYIHGSGTIGNDGVSSDIFIKKIDEETEIINRKIFNRTYKFTQYKEKLVSKGSCKPPRQISIPTIRDRITLKILSNYLQGIYKNDVIQEIPKIKIEKLKGEIEKSNYNTFLKIDIQKFYPSIEHHILLKKLGVKFRKKEAKEIILSALRTATVAKPDKSAPFNTRGVPQGLAISNILAEVYLKDLDDKIKKLNCYYLRYVDDIVILCNGNTVDSILNTLSDEFEKLNLESHSLDDENDKSERGHISESFSYLGYLFKDGDITVRKSSVYKLESSLAKIFTTFKYKTKPYRSLSTKSDIEQFNRHLSILEWRLNLRITGCIFQDTKRGWLFYFSQINDMQLLREMDFTVQKLCARFGVQGKVNVKKFVKTFHESKITDKRKHRYIVNFDEFGVKDKRTVLSTYLGMKAVDKLPDTKVDEFFGKRISTIVKELESDISSIS